MVKSGKAMTAVNIFWRDAEHTILCTEYDGAWTWDDFHNSVNESVRMMEQVDHRVDLIVAPSTKSVMPHGSASPHFKWAIQTLPPNFGLQVIVTRNKFSRSIATIFSKLFSSKTYHDRMFFAANMDEAYTLIMKDRETNRPKQSPSQ